MDTKDFQETAEHLIRTVDDPTRLQQKLTDLVQARYPVMIFKAGETIPMHEFESRFKRAVCAGNETRFAQWPVRVVEIQNGELLLALGTGMDGKIG